MIGLFLAAALALQAAPQASAMTPATTHLPRPNELGLRINCLRTPVFGRDGYAVHSRCLRLL